MKKLLLMMSFIPIFSYAQDVKVKGYYKKNGTYVAPHYRSSPNSTATDNWSTKGNYNPYTGEEGKKDDNSIIGYNYFPSYPYSSQGYDSHSTSIPFDGVEVISGSSITVNGKIFNLWGVSDYNDNLLCGYTKCAINAKLYLKWTINNAAKYYPIDVNSSALTCKIIDKDKNKAVCRVNTIDLSAAMLLSGFVYPNHDDTNIYDSEYYNARSRLNTQK